MKEKTKKPETEEKVEVEDTTTTCPDCGKIIYKRELCSCKKDERDRNKF